MAISTARGVVPRVFCAKSTPRQIDPMNEAPAGVPTQNRALLRKAGHVRDVGVERGGGSRQSPRGRKEPTGGRPGRVTLSAQAKTAFSCTQASAADDLMFSLAGHEQTSVVITRVRYVRATQLGCHKRRVDSDIANVLHTQPFTLRMLSTQQ